MRHLEIELLVALVHDFGGSNKQQQTQKRQLLYNFGRWIEL
jgi:hypothetical protein